MGQLVFQATAGGQVALVGPNPSTNFSLNVPAVNSTLATLAAQTFTGTQTLTTLTSPAATALTLQSAGTTAITVDTSQNVGIGTSSPAYPFEVKNASGIASITSTTGTNLAYWRTSNTGGANLFGLDNSVGALTGTAYSNLLYSTANTPWVFINNSTEKMRLDSSGNLLVGTTSVGGTGITLGPAGGYRILTTAGTALTNQLIFANANGTVGSITTNGSVTLYNTTSDYRLKDVVSTISDSGSRIDALQPINYTMKADGSAQRGFLAHQFQAIYPNSVSGEKDAVDAEGKPVYQAMQASSPEAMADIFAELQSLRKRVAQLESK